MTVVVNGELVTLPNDATVAMVTRQLGIGDGRGVAVAVNDEVVTRGAWETRQLSAGDRVEVLTAVQGGA